MIMQFECNLRHVPQVLDALAGLPVHGIKLLEPKPVPQAPKKVQEFEDLAQRIARHVAPRLNQPMRKEVLLLALRGGDTFWDQQGEADPALRNGTGALSKALRRFARIGDPSPLDMLSTRTREYFSSGPGKGQYKGTRYTPTKLGKRVYEILKEKGQL